MNKGTLIYSLVFLLFIGVGCEKEDGIDDDLSFLNTAGSANIDKVIDISTDNSGIVKITPPAPSLASLKRKTS